MIGKIGSYLQIVAKDPSSTAFVPLAEAYRQIGLMDDALEAARLGTRMLPHFSPGFSTLGRILGQMGHIDDAMSAYAKALSIDRQSQAGLVGLARLHLIRSERDQARKILKQAEEFHPDDRKIADMLIALDLPRPWSKIKQADQAQVNVPPEATKTDEPEESISTATLAEIYVKQGLLDKAVKVYQDILKQNPNNDAARDRMLQLQEQSCGKEEIAVVEHSSEVEKAAVKPECAEVEAVPATSMISPKQQHNEPEDQSVLTVFQRWLSAIKQGRANV